MDLAKPLRQITLTFRADCQDIANQLSAIRCIETDLWLGADEGTTVERFTFQGETADHHETFSIADYLELPKGAAEEIDIEGLAYADYYLWIVGSHSLKRKKVNLDFSAADLSTPDLPTQKSRAKENLKRLQTLSREENRYFLGRIPLVDGQLFRQCSHPEHPDQVLTAAQLKRKKTGNQLTHALREDSHLATYINADIPGKENGFDVEGIAVMGDRILLGLRGPVLRGWAIILELSLVETSHDTLELAQGNGDKARYRKHFVNLDGLGIRDLCWQGDDLLILAGPTMDLSGWARVFRLTNARDTLASETFVKPQPVLELLDQSDQDKAEGMALLPGEETSLVVVYDSAAAHRLNHQQVKVDVFSLDVVEQNRRASYE